MKTAEEWLKSEWAKQITPTTGSFTAYGIEAIQEDAVLSTLQSQSRVIQIAMNIDATGRYFVLAVTANGGIWNLKGLYEGAPVWEPFVTPPNK